LKKAQVDDLPATAWANERRGPRSLSTEKVKTARLKGFWKFLDRLGSETVTVNPMKNGSSHRSP
jgi:hypothetical protein